MSRSRKLLILVACFVALCVLTVGIVLIEKGVEKIKTVDEVMISFDPEDATAVSWEVGSSKYSFVKEDDVWKLEGDDAFPVDEEVLEDLLESISDYHATFVIEEPESLADYGLKKPTGTITVTAGEETQTLTLGGYSTMDEERYFSVGDGNVYLAAVDVAEDFELEDSDLILYDEMPVSYGTVELVLSGEADLNLIYREDAGLCYSDNYTYYMKEENNYRALDETKSQALVKTLTGLDVTGYVSYDADNEVLSRYNLEEPGLTATLTYLDQSDAEQTVTVDFGYVSDSEIYFRKEGSAFICRTTSTVWESLTECAYEDLAPEEVLNLDWTDVKSIRATIGRDVYTLAFSADSSGTVTCTYAGEEQEADSLENALNSLSFAALEGDNGTASSQDTLELKLIIETGNSAYSPVTVCFYRVDGTDCLVTFNGETLGTIERSVVVNLMEEINKIVL